MMKEFELLRHWLVELRLEPQDVSAIMDKVKEIAREYANEVANEAVKQAQRETKMSATPVPAQTTQAAWPDPARMKKSIIEGVIEGVTPQIREFVLSEVHDAIDVELVNMRDLIRGVVARELDAKLEKAVQAELDKRIKDLPVSMRKWADRDHAA